MLCKPMDTVQRLLHWINRKLNPPKPELCAACGDPAVLRWHDVDKDDRPYHVAFCRPCFPTYLRPRIGQAEMKS